MKLLLMIRRLRTAWRARAARRRALRNRWLVEHGDDPRPLDWGKR